jgi:hypothetical protein
MRGMTIDLKIRAFAGAVILLSLALAYFYSRAWLFLTLFVGFNLLQSAFTKFCPLEMVFKKLEKKAR